MSHDNLSITWLVHLFRSPCFYEWFTHSLLSSARSRHIRQFHSNDVDGEILDWVTDTIRLCKGRCQKALGGFSVLRIARPFCQTGLSSRFGHLSSGVMFLCKQYAIALCPCQYQVAELRWDNDSISTHKPSTNSSGLINRPIYLAAITSSPVL